MSRLRYKKKLALQSRMFRRALPLTILSSVIAAFTVSLVAENDNSVVVYSSEDQVCSEPILHDFEHDSGIRVNAVYDKEAAEQVMKRLLAEKDNPQADVYWANEPIHPDLLKEKGISTPYFSANAQKLPAIFKDSDGYWTAFSARARVLLANNPEPLQPTSLEAYADAQWKNRAVLANPLLNTTGFTLTALFQLWGDERAQKFMARMKNNGVKFSPGNGDSADAVAAGKASFSLVDIDDAFAANAKSPNVQIIYPDQQKNQIGLFLVANAVTLIRGGHHPDNGRKLIDYLLTPEVQRKLAYSPCAQTPLLAGVETPERVKRIENIKYMNVNYSAIRKKFDTLKPTFASWASSLAR
jgi:iron(III) transport system substrate-binding protein